MPGAGLRGGTAAGRRACCGRCWGWGLSLRHPCSRAIRNKVPTPRPGLALLFVLGRSMPNRTLTLSRQAQAAIYYVALWLSPCHHAQLARLYLGLAGAQTVQAFARPRLTASRSKALMRVCQPGPVALNASNTSASTRIFRVGRLECFHAWALSRVTATRRPAAPSTASNVLTVGLPFGPSAR